jgi:hypothetical protein
MKGVEKVKAGKAIFSIFARFFGRVKNFFRKGLTSRAKSVILSP